MKTHLNLDKTPAQEKAEELYNTFFDIYPNPTIAKDSALQSVEEIYKLKLKIGFYLITDEDKEMYYSFWEDVKDEIRKL
jgi:hypothetical protein